MKTISTRTWLAASLMAATVLAPWGAIAKENAREQWRAAFDESLVGKRVVWVPIYLGVLESEWTNVMRDHFQRWGIKFDTRDPNFNADVQLQSITAAINQHPDVLIVQNTSTTFLVNEIKRAMDAGIYVVQINMGSNVQSDAYVGADWSETGKKIAEEIVTQCGAGTSGKVAFIQGEATAAASVDELKGASEVFAKSPQIKLVSTQPANWDANKANQLTTTILQQHPDLCAIWGAWGPMTVGAAQAVKNANLQGKVKVYASSDGQRADCEAVAQGLFTKALSFRGDMQGEAIANTVINLLQGGDKPGAKHLLVFTNQYWVKDKNDAKYCFDPSPASN
jgi:ribose transport system substrate-binding protein